MEGGETGISGSLVLLGGRMEPCDFLRGEWLGLSKESKALKSGHAT